MADKKFSGFTSQAMTGTSKLVGLDGTANTIYTVTELQTGILTGADVSLLTDVDLTTDVTGVLPIGNGGTGSNTLPTTITNSTVNYASDGTGILPITKGGTGVDNYGDSVTAVLNTNAVTGGSLANPGNSTTHVAPLNATTVNDDATLYILQASDSVNPQDWNGAIQVKEGGKYLVEAQYASYGNQSASPEMNMWISVVGGATGNSGYNAAYPIGASVGDIYPWGGGVPSKIDNGSAVIRNSQIITLSIDDYVRIMWRVDGFLTGPGPNIYPVYNALGSGMEGYNVELSITKIA